MCTHKHTHTKPPASILKNHRHENQKRPQKIWKEWQDAWHCTPLTVVELCSQILFGATGSWIYVFYPNIYSVQKSQILLFLYEESYSWH